MALLPASEAAVAAVNYLVARMVPPRVLPKFDFQKAGIPPEFRTVVVIPGMLTRPGSAAQLAERLELHALSSPDPELCFALLFLLKRQSGKFIIILVYGSLKIQL